MLYVDFRLCGGSAPLTPMLFKGQLYLKKERNLKSLKVAWSLLYHCRTGQRTLYPQVCDMYACSLNHTMRVSACIVTPCWFLEGILDGMAI